VSFVAAIPLASKKCEGTGRMCLTVTQVGQAAGPRLVTRRRWGQALAGAPTSQAPPHQSLPGQGLRRCVDCRLDSSLIGVGVNVASTPGQLLRRLTVIASVLASPRSRWVRCQAGRRLPDREPFAELVNRKTILSLLPMQPSFGLISDRRGLVGKQPFGQIGS